MKILLKVIVYIILLPILIVLLVVNFQLHQTPSTQNIGKQSTNKEVLAQLKYLKTQLKAGAGEQMQSIFPEGFIFINVLYGLTWADWLNTIPDSSILFHQGITEISWTLEQLSSEQAKSIFPQDLPLEYGAFYSGWSNYLLGKKLTLLKPEWRDSSEVEQFQEICEKIYQAYQQKGIIFLESYQGGVWQADNIVCIANLAIYDKVFMPQYQDFIKSWVEKLQQYLDPQTGLIPHSARSVTGAIGEGARGSSQSLMLNFLPEINSSFAKSQFGKYKEHFLDYRFFLPAIREYPKGKEGAGDIDSGLIIYDIGAAASIVGIRAFAQNREEETAWQIRNGIEAFGFAFTNEGQRYYLLGFLPIADAFIAWSNSHFTFVQSSPSHLWQIIFHLISLAIIIPILLILRKLK
jgi:hypothetical protein